MMNRVIKFRGKHRFLNDWVYGNYRPTESNWCYIEDEKYVHSVLAETVGQYTTVKDKCGDDVYEGDVLQETVNNNNEFTINGVKHKLAIPDGSETRQYVVEWDTTMCCFVLKRINLPDDFYQSFLMSEVKYCKIVGNIHDNNFV